PPPPVAVAGAPVHPATAAPVPAGAVSGSIATTTETAPQAASPPATGIQSAPTVSAAPNTPAASSASAASQTLRQGTSTPPGVPPPAAIPQPAPKSGQLHASASSETPLAQAPAGATTTYSSPVPIGSSGDGSRAGEFEAGLPRPRALAWTSSTSQPAIVAAPG